MRGLYPRYLFARIFDVVAILFTASHLFRQSGITEENRITVECRFAIFFLHMHI